MPVRPSTLRAGIAAVLGGALAVGLVAPASAAPTSSGVVSHHAAAKVVTTKVTRAPKSVTVVAGHRAKFTVAAKGTKLTYQWYVRKPGASAYVTVSGARRYVYAVTATSRLDGARYRVVVKGAKGKATSASARLVSVSRPKITTTPADREVTSGAKIAFSVTAVGHGLSYAWKIQRPDGSSATLPSHSRTVTITARTAMSGSLIEAVVTNKAGKTVSDPAWLQVRSTAADPLLPEAQGFAGEWFVMLDASDVNADPEVAAASAANVPAPVGSTYVTTSVIACSFDDASPALTIRLRGTDGKLYTAGAAVLPSVSTAAVPDLDDWIDVGCLVYTVGALAPDAVISGATWAVSGPAGPSMPASTEYWALAAR